MIFNPWHSVSIGEEAPKIVEALIEIPKGSRAKYELDKDSGMLRLDRVLYSPFYYPANYGFIPQTLGEDNDPLDILVISQVEIQPMCLVKAKVIGVMRMIDNNEGDDKIIAVAMGDTSVSHIENIDQLPPYFTKELKHFFEEYKRLEKKEVSVDGFQDIDSAIKIIEKSITDYNQNYKK